MITAKGSFDDMRQGFLSGSDDYMVKPVNVNEMVLRVGSLPVSYTHLLPAELFTQSLPDNTLFQQILLVVIQSGMSSGILLDVL